MTLAKETKEHLVALIQAGDVLGVQKMFNEYGKAIIEFRNGLGFTPLHMALYHRHDKLTEWLLAHGADPSIASYNGQKNALHIALWQKNAKIAYEILHKKPDLIKSVDAEGLTPLHYAAMYGDAALVKALYATHPDKKMALQAVSHKGRTVMHIAALHGNCDTLSALYALPGGAALVSQKDAFLHTPVMLIAKDIDHPAVKLFTSCPETCFDAVWLYHFAFSASNPSPMRSELANRDKVKGTWHLKSRINQMILGLTLLAFVGVTCGLFFYAGLILPSYFISSFSTLGLTACAVIGGVISAGTMLTTGYTLTAVGGYIPSLEKIFYEGKPDHELKHTVRVLQQRKEGTGRENNSGLR